MFKWVLSSKVLKVVSNYEMFILVSYSQYIHVIRSSFAIPVQKHQKQPHSINHQMMHISSFSRRVLILFQRR